MPDNTRRDAHKQKDELVEEPKKQETKAKDITPLIASILSRLTINDNSPMHNVGFTVPGMGDEPAKFVTLHELVLEFKTYEDMVLVHEIAIDDNFTLKPAKDKDTIYQIVARTMQNAYWDLMREELNQNPPNKERAIKLLLDIKLAFRALLVGNNDAALAKIEAYLDESKVRENIDNDVSAVYAYTKFIIEVMGMACCKARDGEIAKLQEKKDIVDRLRGIMELLESMQLDMANFVLDTARGELTKYSIQYEKEKFAQLRLATDDKYPATDAWLKRAWTANLTIVVGAEPENASNDDAAVAGASSGNFQLDVMLQNILKCAYIDLLVPNVEYDPFPELLILDKERLKQLKGQVLRMIVCSAVISIAHRAGIPSDGQERKEVADKLWILVKDFTSFAQMKDVLESLWIQVKTMIAGFQEAAGTVPSGIQHDAVLKAEIMKLTEDNSRVFAVVKIKLLQYFEETLDAGNANIAMPVIFRDYAADLYKMGKTFLKIVQHNRAVYGSYYGERILNFK